MMKVPSNTTELLQNHRKRKQIDAMKFSTLSRPVSDDECCSLDEFLQAAKKIKLSKHIRGHYESLSDIEIRLADDLNLSDTCNENWSDTNSLYAKLREKMLSRVSNVWTWGNSSMGQLGHGDTQRKLVPGQVLNFAGKKVLNVAAGWGHTLFLNEDGRLFSCGFNNFGQLGLRHQNFTSLPQPITLLNDEIVTQISVKCSCHSLALTETGKIFAWGCNQYGQLGLASYGHRLVPVEVSSLREKNIVKMFAGGNANEGFCFAVDREGGVYTWGMNSHGQLGLGDTKMRNYPHRITTLTGVRTMAVGASHAIAVTENRVYSWGNNNCGSLGHADESISMCKSPTEIIALRDKHIVSVACGYCFSLALTENGDVYAWGGERDNSTMTAIDENSRNVPLQITSLKKITAISAGYTHMLAVSSDRVLFAWGCNQYGQIGMGDMKDRQRPDEVKSMKGKNITAICTGGHHSVALIS